MRWQSKVRAVLLFSTSIYILLMTGLGYAWYAHQWTPEFHLFNDAAEWKQMDKFAHFFWTFQTSAIAARLLFWARPDERKAAVGGAVLGFLFVSSVEIADGFSDRYGASLFDVGANALGCAAFLLQRIFWKKINIWPKFSFHPTAFAPLRPAMLGDGFLQEVLKDYNGQTFWYSVNFRFIPLPNWLTVAVGIGAEGMIHSRDAENVLLNLSPHRKYFLSLDLNLTHVETSSKSLNSLLSILNVIKIPAPTLEFSSQGVRFHTIYF